MKKWVCYGLYFIKRGQFIKSDHLSSGLVGGEGSLSVIKNPTQLSWILSLARVWQKNHA